MERDKTEMVVDKWFGYMGASYILHAVKQGEWDFLIAAALGVTLWMIARPYLAKAWQWACRD